MSFWDDAGSVVSATVPGVSFFQDVGKRGFNAITDPTMQTVGGALFGGVGSLAGAGYDFLDNNSKQDQAGADAYNRQVNDLAAAQAEQIRQAMAYAAASDKRAQAQYDAWEADQKAKSEKEAAAQKIAEERATATKNQLQDQSTEFDKNMENQKINQGAIDQTQAVQGLNTQLKQVDQTANQRGLLYSGIKQGAQADLRANTAGEIAAQRANTNEQINAQGDYYRKLASQGTMDNQSQLQNDYQQRAQGAQNIYAQGLAHRRGNLANSQGVNSLYNQQTQFNNNINQNQAPVSSGYMPQAFAAGGQVLGAVGSKAMQSKTA